VREVRAAERHLVRVEPRFAPLVAAAGPCPLCPKAEFDVFPALARAIVGQQLSGTAAATIWSRVPAVFGRADFPAPAEVLAVPEDALRPAGISRAKAAAIRDLAAKVIDGTVPGAAALHSMDDEEIVARLTGVRGIGRWTVEMLLVFDLGRLDVLPVADLGVRKGYARLFRRPGAKVPELVRRAERWRPYRSVASWYLWRALDTPGAER
jgi:3-methyladenine DNA glycosylase/8-oxoguanine DNA glycosylase